MTLLLYDTTDTNPCPIPKNAYAVGGYVGGKWPTYNELVRQYPNAHHLSIAVFPGERADFADCETYDFTPQQAIDAKHRGEVRGCYANRSTWNENPGMFAAFSKPEERWVAQWDNDPSIPGGFGAKQFIDHGPNGENYDISSVSSTFFGAPPKPVDPYAIYPTAKFHIGPVVTSEHDLIVHTDGALEQPTKYRLYLHALLAQDRYARDRIWHVATVLDPLPGGKPNWAKADRGARWQGFNNRIKKIVSLGVR